MEDVNNETGPRPLTEDPNPLVIEPLLYYLVSPLPAAKEAAVGETTPAETAPSEVTPVEAAPADVAPVEVAPAAEAPAESAPAEVAAAVVPAESAPAEAAPAAESVPAEAAPAEKEPAGAVPAEAIPADKPVPETTPVTAEPAETTLAAPVPEVPPAKAPVPDDSAIFAGVVGQQVLVVTTGDRLHLQGLPCRPVFCGTVRAVRTGILTLDGAMIKLPRGPSYRLQSPLVIPIAKIAHIVAIDCNVWIPIP